MPFLSYFLHYSVDYREVWHLCFQEWRAAFCDLLLAGMRRMSSRDEETLLVPVVLG